MMVFGRPWLNSRVFGPVSVVTGIVGLGFIVLGGATVTTVGALLVILSTVSLFFAVGAYIDGQRGAPAE